jgi:glycosyltransferase involved in cell wall biosynthesis
MMMTMSAALVVPAWNEADSIGAVLAEVPRDAVDRIFVITGDSPDRTAEVAAAGGAEAVIQPRPGYGAACLAGAHLAARAGAQIVVFLDGDYSDPPGALDSILAPLLAGKADLVLGCRDLRAHPGALPLHARLGNQLVLWAIRLLLRRRLRDLPSFKAVRLDSLQLLQMRELTYGWTTELIVKAVRADLRIMETPIVYRPRLAGRSKVSGSVRGTLGAAWKLCWCALRYARWTPPSRAAAPLEGFV